MAAPDCTDICEIIMDKLLALGFKLDTADEDHSDIIEALAQCELIKVI